MTREQAIDLLDNLIGMIEDNQENDYDKAFKMAIQALQAQTETKCNPNDCPHPYGTYETCNECKANGDNVKAQADGEYISKSDMIDWLKDIRHKMKPQNYHTASEFEIAENQIWNLIQMLQMGALPTVAIPSAEPCEDVISRQAVINAIKEITPVDTEYDCTLYDKVDIMYVLSELPTVIIPSAEPKTGHWKRISMDKYSEHAKYWYRCDKCGKKNLGNTDWCPNCGCRMVEPQEEKV